MTNSLEGRNNDRNMRVANAAAINAISTVGTDYSGGATHWRGNGSYNIFCLNNPYDGKTGANPNIVKIGLDYSSFPSL